MSATVGGIVAVFLLFAFQELRTARRELDPSEDTLDADVLREQARLNTLVAVASIAMAVLLLDAILVTVGLLVESVSSKALAMAAMVGFTFSIMCMVLVLIAYLLLEARFFPTPERAQDDA